MNQLIFSGSLIYNQDGRWKINPINKKSWDLVRTTVGHNHISFSKVFSNFKDGDFLEINIKKVNKHGFD